MSDSEAVLDLVRAATRRGHTVLPVAVLREVLERRTGRRLTDSGLESPELVPVLWHGEPALALSEVADGEELLADGLAALAGEHRLAVVVGSDRAARRSTARAAVPAGTPFRLVDPADRVGVDELLPVVEDLAEGVVLVLSLDPHRPVGAVVGAVALDVAASGLCPVLTAPDPEPAGAPARAAVRVGEGSWPGPSADHAVADVPSSGPDDAVRRVRQLVHDSIPRTFGVSADLVRVLTVHADGPPAGSGGSLAPDVLVGALGRSVTVVPGGPVDPDRVAEDAGDDEVMDGTYDPPAGPAEAAVVVLSGPDLDRAVLYAALRSARRHVSLVRPVSVDLAAVAARPARARRTRLRSLLEATSRADQG